MNKSNKYKELAQNTIIFFIGNIGSKLITLLLLPLYTAVLETNEYGTVDVVNTTVSLLIPILTINIQDAVLRFTLDKDYCSEDVLSSSVWVVGISSFIVSLAVCLFKYFGVIKLECIYVIYLILSFVFMTFQNIFSMYLRAKGKVLVIVTSGILTTFLTYLLSIIFLTQIKIGVAGFIAANLIASLFGLLYSCIYGKVENVAKRKLKLGVLKKMLLYSAPLVVNSVAWWINTASDRYILTFFCGASINGIYAVSYKIPTILVTIQGFFYNAWSVSAIKEFDPKDTDGFIGNIYEIFCSISTISCAVLMLINPIIANFLFEKDFYEAYHYVPLLLVGSVFNGLALFEGCLFTAVRKTNDVSKTTLVGAGINTILNILLIRFWGAYGAAVATMVGYIVVWGVRTYVLAKIIKMKVRWIRHIICLGLILIFSMMSMLKTNSFLQFFVLIILVMVQRTTILRGLSLIKTKNKS